MSDTSLVFNLVARDRASQELERLKERFAGVGSAIAKVSGAGLALPGLAAAATAGAGLAAGAAAAGLAVKAFQAAAMPQLESVTGAWGLYSQAQDAAAKGGEEAAAAQAAYTQALAKMTPATRDTAEAFIGLKSDFGQWSDGLSGTTMPVFTKGIEVLRDLLPTMTPFVEAAAGALGNFVDEIAAGTKSAGFKEWAADMSTAAGPALSDFLTTIKNVGVGFGGLLQAFLPVSSGMTGGLVDMTAAFANWGQNLPDSEGFAKFLDTAATGGETLAMVGGAAVNLFTAVAPLLGTTAMLANAFAKVINATPTPVLTALATVITGAVIGLKAYALYTAITGTVSDLLRTRLGQQVGAWLTVRAQAAASMASTAASAVANAARTAAAWAAASVRMAATFVAGIIRAALVSVAQFAMMAARAVAWAATMAAQWLIAMGPIGWVIAAVVGLVVLIIANWDTVKRWTLAIWDFVWKKVKSAVTTVLSVVTFLSRLPGMVGGYFGRMKDWAVRKALDLVKWMAGWPGRIARSIGSLGSLLYDKGQSIVTGLWNGIKSMGSWLRGILIGWAKDIIPGPIAKALGIGSPSKVMAEVVGRWLPPGIAMGAEENRGVLDKTMQGLVNPELAAPVRPLTAGMAPLMGAQAGGGTVVVRLEFVEGEFKKLLRKTVRVDGRGSIQILTG